MARYIAVQTLPAAATQDEVIEAGRVMAGGARNGTHWLRGWMAGEDGRLFSEWEAPQESAVRAAIEQARLFPLEAVHPVEVIEPGWFTA